MNKEELIEEFFNLRNEQANCTPDERAEIQEKIEEIQSKLDES